MQNTQPIKKRKLRFLELLIIFLGAALFCVVTNITAASLIALPLQLIHKALSHGPG